MEVERVEEGAVWMLIKVPESITPRAISLYLVCSERRQSEEEEDKSFSFVVFCFLGIGVRSFVEARPPGIASCPEDGAQKPPDF